MDRRRIYDIYNRMYCILGERKVWVEVILKGVPLQVLCYVHYDKTYDIRSIEHKGTDVIDVVIALSDPQELNKQINSQICTLNLE